MTELATRFRLVLEEDAKLPEGRLEDLLTAAQDMELKASGLSKPQQATVAAVHILACLRAAQLEEARFVWKRTPDDVKESSREVRAAWGLGKHLWTRDYAAFFTAAREMKWSVEVAGLLAKLVEAVRGRVLSLYSRSYDCVAVSALAAACGVDDDEAVALTTSAGWAATPDKPGFVSPPAPGASAAGAGAVPAAQSDVDALKDLTAYILSLEQHSLTL